MCFDDFLPMRTLCDAYHKEFESWTYLNLVCSQVAGSSPVRGVPFFFQATEDGYLLTTFNYFIKGK